MRWQIPVGLFVMVLFLALLLGFVSKAYPPPPTEPKFDDPWLTKYTPPRGYVAYRASGVSVRARLPEPVMGWQGYS